MVIYLTARHRRVAILACRELGEWRFRNRAAERVVEHPARPKALIPALPSRRGPGLMLARLRPLCASGNTVQSATERVFG